MELLQLENTTHLSWSCWLSSAVMIPSRESFYEAPMVSLVKVHKKIKNPTVNPKSPGTVSSSVYEKLHIVSQKKHQYPHRDTTVTIESRIFPYLRRKSQKQRSPQNKN